MPTSNPLDILLAHDEWATRQMLDTCAKLTDEQLHRRFEMGPGSLHDTLTHVLAAMRVWGDLLASREQRPRLEGTNRTVADLTALHDEIAKDFIASAHARPTVTGTTVSTSPCTSMIAIFGILLRPSRSTAKAAGASAAMAAHR